jgi:phospholipase A1
MKRKRTLILSAILLALLVVTTTHAFAEAAAAQPLPQQTQDTHLENDDSECDTTPPITAYKTNYFSMNTLPNHENAQIKFQFSVKYKFFNRDYSVQGRPLSLYLAYSQKSLWNVGQESMPFEESNYNPEAFFDYRVNISRGPVSLRNIILSPYEHESNGLAGPQSRSWNRLYAAVRLGYLPMEEPCNDGTVVKDRVELFLKVWHAYGYADQDAYLQTIGSDKTFLGYEGHGEVNLVLRDVLAWGDWGNRIEITSRIGGKDNIALQYVQKIPALNFTPYLQYWRGYDETLLRFDRYGQRTFLGVSFVY